MSLNEVRSPVMCCPRDEGIRQREQQIQGLGWIGVGVGCGDEVFEKSS